VKGCCGECEAIATSWSSVGGSSGSGVGGLGSLISGPSSSPCDAPEDGEGWSVNSLLVDSVDDWTLEDETARVAGGGVWVDSVDRGDREGGVDCCACVVGVGDGCLIIGRRGVCCTVEERERVAWMGVATGVATGVITGGVLPGLCEKVLINSSCTACLLSTKGDATAVTGVMAVSVGVLVKRCGNTGACEEVCSPCDMMDMGALMGATVVEGEGLGEGVDSNWWKGEWESRSSVFAGCLMGVMLDVVVVASPSAPFPLLSSPPPNPMARISANTLSSFPPLASGALPALALFFGLRPGVLPGLGLGSFPPFPFPFPVLAWCGLGSGGGFSSEFGMLSLLGRNQRIVWIVGVCELKGAGV
jgi:hypothetical protein